MKRLIMISTYPPEKCGIAEYAFPMRLSLLKAIPESCIFVVAVTDSRRPTLHYGSEVVATMPGNASNQVVEQTSNVVNELSCDAVIIHFDPGLFRIACLVRLMKKISRPIMLICHNIDLSPTPMSGTYTRLLIDLSHTVVVPIPFVMRKLTSVLRQDFRKKVSVIPWPRNAPEGNIVDKECAKRTLGWTGRSVLLTYGFMSSFKGVDLAIAALGRVVSSFPNVLYAVVGQVHPRQKNPRRFIDDLQRLVSRKGLQAHVYFKFEYASSEQLDLFMSACDAYVCPHLAPGGEYQISSGTIAHALSAGKPVVSVDHILGREIAAMGCGLAVMRCDNAFANALREIIVNIKLRESLERNAQAAGKQMTWQHVAGRYAAILNRG